jgi:hypothetical protein
MSEPACDRMSEPACDRMSRPDEPSGASLTEPVRSIVFTFRDPLD